MAEIVMVLKLVLLLFISSGDSSHFAGNDLTINTRGDGAAGRCEDLEVRFNDRDATSDTLRFTVPASGLFEIEAGPNGGVTVLGSSESQYRVEVCRFVGDARVSDVQADLNGRRLAISGPRDGEWTTHVIVHAPARAELSAMAHNGPVAIREVVEGRLTVGTKNGPLTVIESTGSITGDTTNGPISLKGGSGEFRLTAKNGPLSVKLENEWRGSLDASTKNGPLSVSVPEGFSSGILVESLGHGPVKSDIAGARKTWDDDTRLIELGSGPTVIRLSTVNGPVSVKSR
jgi:hypothetical protein